MKSTLCVYFECPLYYFYYTVLLLAYCIHLDQAVSSFDNQRCIKSDNHKDKPSLETHLHECNAYNQLSCCDANTTKMMHVDILDGTSLHSLYNFNYNHCGELSKSCMMKFMENNCFYECSANIYPWIIEVNNTYRDERFKDVPLCQSECFSWWNACKTEKTCVDNWSTGFVWKATGNGGPKINSCPKNTTCQTFEEVFNNDAKYFCENVFGPNDFKVIDDTEDDALCLKLNFTGENPNTEVVHKLSLLDKRQCIQGKHHKPKPGPEPNLDQCSAFKDMACCTPETATQLFDQSPLYNFNYSHCGPMSSQCQASFLENNCFYECSPNVYEWAVNETNSYRKQSFKNVPLCLSQCVRWWESCKGESTCTDNWSTGFDWVTSASGTGKENVCPHNETCRPFAEVFKDAVHFCESVFGPNDYKVVDDSNDADALCLNFNFTGTNPNTKVVLKILSSGSAAPTPGKKLTTLTPTSTTPKLTPSTSSPPLTVNPTTTTTTTAIKLPATTESADQSSNHNYAVGVGAVFISMVLVVLIGVVGYRMWGKYRGTQFHHQGVPFTFSGSILRRTPKPTTRTNTEYTEAQMSFMNFEEEEDAPAEVGGGSLQMHL